MNALWAVVVVVSASAAMLGVLRTLVGMSQGSRGGSYGERTRSYVEDMGHTGRGL